MSIGIESKVTKVMELSDWTYAAAPVDRKALDCISVDKMTIGRGTNTSREPHRTPRGQDTTHEDPASTPGVKDATGVESVVPPHPTATP